MTSIEIMLLMDNKKYNFYCAINGERIVIVLSTTNHIRLKVLGKSVGG